MKKVNIIGAGIAGLSAGCYLQMNGYDTQIFELHNLPGGLCTSWKRKGFTIDNCIHWLVGSSPSNNFYNLWTELVDMQSIKFVNHEEWFRIEGNDGRFIRLFTDVDRLEKELLQKAPEDAKLINEFIGAVRGLNKFNLPIEKARETYGTADFIKFILWLLPFLKAMRKWNSVSLQEYAQKCRDPLLNRMFRFMFWPETAVFWVMMNLAWMHKKSAGYPIGGSLEFARLIEKRYLELGGKINYKSKVVKIITEDDSATGIMLENNDVQNCDTVISAADGHYTIFEMLDGKYVDEKIKDFYDRCKPFPSYVQVSVGVSRTFEDEPHEVILTLDKPLTVDQDTTLDEIVVRIYNHDKTLAPEGKTLITVKLGTYGYEYWDNLKKHDTVEYGRQKERIANEIAQILEKRYGNLKSNIEMINVSTPSTVVGYTNNWKGSYEGWLMTPGRFFKNMSKTLPGLKNFYMIGQWVEPGGGLARAMMSGRWVSQIMCKKDKRPFVTSTP